VTLTLTINTASPINTGDVDLRQLDT